MNKFLEILKTNRFQIISWGITAFIVIGLLSGALWWAQTTAGAQALKPQPTITPGQNPPKVALPGVGVAASEANAIERHLQLKTNIPERPRYAAVTYRVAAGDAMFAIAKKFNLKPETILYSNKDVLDDNPHNLRPGMELLIPPVDGVYYKWQEGDTLQDVANKFKADVNGDKKVDQTDVDLLVEAILNFPGNNLDLTDPQIKPGTLILIPGGQRELVDWSKFIPTIPRNPAGGTGTSEVGGSSCGGGPVGSGFIWPTLGPHTISGNGYGPGHLGIDITGNEGDPVVAAAAGVVTMAQGGWNYGYGNVIQIDHGNGYTTIYAHLSVIGVSVCQAVAAGQWIGAVGNTGNSFGAHLHFEIRQGGANVNPLYLIQ
ncbi:MAG: M23 family metallopeptidase [Anaerolineae bacterium]